MWIKTSKKLYLTDWSEKLISPIVSVDVSLPCYTSSSVISLCVFSLFVLPIEQSVVFSLNYFFLLLHNSIFILSKPQKCHGVTETACANAEVLCKTSGQIYEGLLTRRKFMHEKQPECYCYLTVHLFSLTLVLSVRHRTKVNRSTESHQFSYTLFRILTKWIRR